MERCGLEPQRRLAFYSRGQFSERTTATADLSDVHFAVYLTETNRIWRVKPFDYLKMGGNDCALVPRLNRIAKSIQQRIRPAQIAEFCAKCPKPSFDSFGLRDVKER